MSKAESKFSILEGAANSSSVARGVVEIRGQVKTPGDVSYRADADIYYYLRQAGGTTQGGARNVMIVREENNRKKSFMHDLMKMDRPPEIQGGDILVFHGIVPVGKNGSSPELLVAPKPERVGSQEALSDMIKSPHFKRMLNQMLSIQVEQGFKSIAVLSLNPGEGKTLVTSALAMGYANFLHSRVLVVDTVAQTQDRTLYLERVAGDYFHGDSSESPQVEPGFVDFLTTKSMANGHYETADFQVGRYVETLRNRYDVILLDTCALNHDSTTTMDPVVLSRYVDAAILVTSAKSLQKKEIQTIGAELRRNRITLMGVLFNSGVQ